MIKKALLTGLALLLTSGCVSKDYVKEQVDLTKNYANARSLELELKILQLENELLPYKKKFASCFDGKYDYDKRCIDPSQQDMEMIQGIHPIIVAYFLKPKNKKSKEKELVSACGTGILLENNYVLTARHVIDENSPAIKNTKSSKLGFNPKKLEDKIILMGSETNFSVLEIVDVSKKYDLALLKIRGKKTKLNKMEVNIGDSDKLKIGHFLYLIGNPNMAGIHQHQAIVATYENKTLKPDGLNGTFNINTTVFPGYSGGPVFAIKDGTFELIGIISTTSHFDAQMVSINHALEEFKEYLQK